MFKTRRFLRLLLLAAFGVSPTAALAATDMDVGKVYRATAPSVALITVLDAYGQPLSLGSGFFIDRKGTLATNLHVVAGGSKAKVRLADSEEILDVVGVVASDEKRDLALLRVNKKPTRALPLGTLAQVTVGERICTIGNPLGLKATISEGIVSGIRHLEEGFDILQITAPISPGSSGGPVLDARGKVIGVASATLVEGQNLNFAIPAHYVASLSARQTEPRKIGSLRTRPAIARGILHAKEAVRVVDYSVKQHLEIVLSLMNDNQFAVKNVKILVVFREPLDPKAFYPKGSTPLEKDLSEPLHFLPIVVEKVIPAGLPLRVSAGSNKKIQWRWIPAFRVLDYEILPTSGWEQLEFAPAR